MHAHVTQRTLRFMTQDALHTLVLIDLQAEFLKWVNNSERLLSVVAEEIHYSVTTGSPIVFVEYEGDGPTHRRLYNLVPKKLRYRVEKTNDSALEALTRLQEKISLPKHYRIGGVNTDACILATVLDLSDGVPWVESLTVLAEACDSGDGPENHLWGLQEMERFANIEAKSNKRGTHPNNHKQPGQPLNAFSPLHSQLS